MSLHISNFSYMYAYWLWTWYNLLSLFSFILQLIVAYKRKHWQNVFICTNAKQAYALTNSHTMSISIFTLMRTVGVWRAEQVATIIHAHFSMNAVERIWYFFSFYFSILFFFHYYSEGMWYEHIQSTGYVSHVVYLMCIKLDRI